MRQISGGDAFYLFTDKESRHQHISALYIYDPSTAKEKPLRFKTILNNIEDRLGSSPIFRQKLVNVPFNLDYPYWINDPEFDLEYHVRHIALPKPGDWRQLCIQVSRLHARSLDMTRPVWETYVIEGLDNIDFLPKGAFAILTKIHHVAIDGVDVSDYRLASLRQQVAVVSQHGVLFNDTVAANIAYGRLHDADRDSVQRAAQQAGAMSFIERLPDGLDTLIGSEGVQLSGG